MNSSDILHQIMARHQSFYLSINQAALSPMVIIFTKEGATISVILEEVSELDEAEKQITELVDRHDADQVAFISESWVLMGKPEDIDTSIRPSDNPNSIEAVVSVVIDPGGSSTGIQRIDRDADGKITGLVTVKEGTEGTISIGFLENVFAGRKTLQ